MKILKPARSYALPQAIGRPLPECMTVELESRSKYNLFHNMVGIPVLVLVLDLKLLVGARITRFLLDFRAIRR